MRLITPFLIAALGVGSAAADAMPRDLRCMMLDVGQGDAVLLVTPRGGTVLVDGGPDARALAAVRDHLPYGTTRIDAVILSHPHADHMAGLVPVLEAYEVGRVFLPSNIVASKLDAEFLALAHRRAVPVTFPSAPMAFSLDGVEFAFVYPVTPASGQISKRPNDDSLVVRVRYGESTLLLTGDLETAGEAALLRSGASVEADVLKTGHHGSKTSTTPAFLAAVRPSIALVSVGAHNLYRHPSPDVMTRLDAVGIAVYRTDLHGTVTVRCNLLSCWMHNRVV